MYTTSSRECASLVCRGAAARTEATANAGRESYRNGSSARLRVAAGSVLLILLVCGCQCLLDALRQDPGEQVLAPVVLELVAGGLTSPVGLVPASDGSRLFVVDQIGQIRIIDADGNLLPTPLLDLADRMVELMPDFDERGLLSMAFHPDYTTNRRFFVIYSAPRGAMIPEGYDSQLNLSEFLISQSDPNQADPTSERILLTIGKPQFNHNGGQLAFGLDGLLYISVGDGGGANDVGLGHNIDTGNGQDKTTLLGKLLRIDVDNGDPFGIPADNPFVGNAAVRDEIFALGMRNPWRFSFDGSRLFLADVGQDLYEEVNLIVAGGNYGWRTKEASFCFDPANPTSPPASCPDNDPDGQPLIDPIIEYQHFDDEGIPVGVAVIGGFVYRGASIEGLAGDYVFGDFSTGFDAADGTLFAATEQSDGTWRHRELAVTGKPDQRIGAFVLGFGRDNQGEIYVLTSQNLGPTGTTGQVYRLLPAP